MNDNKINPPSEPLPDKDAVEPINEGVVNGGEKPFPGFFGEKLFPILLSFSRIRLLDSIRESVIWSIPFLVAGFLIIFFLSGQRDEPLKRGLFAFSSAMGLFGFLLAFLIPFCHSRKGDYLRAAVSGLFSLVCFIVLLPHCDMTAQGILKLLTGLSRGGVLVAFVLGGIFALFDGYYAPRLRMVSFWQVRIASFVVLLLVFISMKSFSFDLFGWVEKLITPLLSGADTLPAALLVVALMCLFWLAGIHGSGLVGGIVLPFYMVALNANIVAQSAGEPMPYVIAPPFFIWCLIGGTGATLPLCVFMLFSRSAHLRKVGYVSILPSLVNINEPLLFGTPLILNPVIAVPFVLAPVVLAAMNYSAIYFGLVEKIYLFPPFTLPTPLYAYLSNLDYRSAILIGADIIIASLIYYPFFRALEKIQLIKEKAAGER